MSDQDGDYHRLRAAEEFSAACACTDVRAARAHAALGSLHLEAAHGSLFASDDPEIAAGSALAGRRFGDLDTRRLSSS